VIRNTSVIITARAGKRGLAALERCSAPGSASEQPLAPAALERCSARGSDRALFGAPGYSRVQSRDRRPEFGPNSGRSERLLQSSWWTSRAVPAAAACPCAFRKAVRRPRGNRSSMLHSRPKPLAPAALRAASLAALTALCLVRPGTRAFRAATEGRNSHRIPAGVSGCCKAAGGPAGQCQPRPLLALSGRPLQPLFNVFRPKPLAPAALRAASLALRAAPRGSEPRPRNSDRIQCCCIASRGRPCAFRKAVRRPRGDRSLPAETARSRSASRCFARGSDRALFGAPGYSRVQSRDRRPEFGPNSGRSERLLQSSWWTKCSSGRPSAAPRDQKPGSASRGRACP
jgi:hypothetical protein